MVEVKDGKIVLPPNMEENLKKRDLQDKLQWEYAEIADKQIKQWCSSQAYEIYKICYTTHWGEYLEVLFFVKSDKMLKKIQEQNIDDLIKEKFLKILDEIGYIAKFNDKVRMDFDSDEHVQRNYHGNYGLRLTDD